MSVLDLQGMETRNGKKGLGSLISHSCGGHKSLLSLSICI
ncbi:MAG: SapB/AmfS family lanthipeptide [Actinomycetota bacterium]|nr:SapB/AmfS family lanthipeptide [Actinomycetota bacterium]